MSQSVSRLALLAVAIVSVSAVPLTAQSSNKGAESPSAAVEEFMRAAADSNLTRMAELFGTEKGSAEQTGHPSDYPKRMVIMQAALHDVLVRAQAETDMGKKNHRLVTAEIARGGCKVTVPIIAVKAKTGWLIREFDLTAVWDGINRPCVGTGKVGNTGG